MAVKKIDLHQLKELCGTKPVWRALARGAFIPVQASDLRTWSRRIPAPTFQVLEESKIGIYIEETTAELRSH